MPYKDPAARKEANKRAVARYRAANPEKARMVQHNVHQKNRAEILARMTKRNRALGHKERPKDGPRVKPTLEVPASRRYRFYKGPDDITRLYFSTRKGFTLQDMKQILAEFKQVLLPSAKA